MEPIDRIGRFRIVERLGSGSSRDVFLGEDDAGARVVIKVLAAPHRNQGLLDPQLADEATAYARLAHANLVKVVDLFSAEGHFVIALEFLDGASLNVVRAVLKRGGNALDDAAASYVGTSVFAAMAAAHDALDASGKPAPVLHRNINPSNIMVTWDGVVKLGNFNVANVASVLRDSNPGFTWGSYGYFAPEHVMKLAVGPPADVYSASLVMWELYAGRKAIERGALTETEVLTAMAAPRITSLDVVRADLDPRVRDVLRAGLEVDPGKRTITAAQIRDVLGSLGDFETERKRLATILERVRPDATRPRIASRPKTPQAAKPAPPRPDAAPPPAAEAPGSYSVLAPPDPDPVRAPVVPPATPRPPVVLAPLVQPPRAATVALAPAPAAPLPPTPAPSPPLAPVPVPMPVPAPAPLFPPAPALTPTPMPPPLPPFSPLALEPTAIRPRSVVPILLVSCGLLGIATIAAVLVFLPKKEIRTPPATATSAAAPLPPPTAPPATAVALVTPTAPAPPSTPPAASATPAVSSPPATIAPDRGELRFPPFAAGHRIFVDGHVVGDGADPAVVRCGPHDVRIGSAGTVQHVDVPCGGALTVTSR